MVADDGVDVGKVGLDEDGLELEHFIDGAVHEDDVDNVVANVPLSVDLKLWDKSLWTFDRRNNLKSPVLNLQYV